MTEVEMLLAFQERGVMVKRFSHEPLEDGSGVMLYIETNGPVFATCPIPNWWLRLPIEERHATAHLMRYQLHDDPGLVH